MKIKTDADKELLITSEPTFWGRIFIVASILLAFASILLFIFTAGKGVPFYFGGGTAALLLFFSYLAFFEQSVFKFDIESRQLEWSRTKSFQTTSGKVPFSDISDVILQSNFKDISQPNMRVAIRTKDDEIPLTTTYYKNRDNCRYIAERVRKAIDLD